MHPRRLAKLWETTQVELQGRYSNKRVIELAKYTRETSSARALAVALASPLPCLIITFLIDAIPLADPSEGLTANKMFFLREFLCLLMTTTMVIHQIRRGMHNALPYPAKSFIRDSVVVAALTTGLVYELGKIVGFPVPFSSLIILPAWSAMTLFAMAIQWTRHIRANWSIIPMLVGMTKLMLCDVLLIFIYPPYYYIFTTLPEQSQTAFTVLLPVIKLLMRNLFARAVRHLGDETPELVIFNADAFGSLFVSYCMQSSPSIWSSIVIITADAVLIALSLRDILHCREGLEELEDHIDSGPMWIRCRETVGYKLLGGRRPTTLERAGILLEHRESYHFTISHTSNGRSATVLPSEFTSHEQTSNVFDVEDIEEIDAGVKRGCTPAVRFHGNSVFPEVAAPARSRPSSYQNSKKYLLKVRRLLYMAEFILLLNYIEVVIPQNFAIYLIATYHLPNREYYAVFHNMNENQLYATLRKIIIYWFLQLLSLLGLDLLLRRTLGLSPIRVLAFVLENQVDYVQIHLTYWLCYNAQCTLRHIVSSFLEAETLAHSHTPRTAPSEGGLELLLIADEPHSRREDPHPVPVTSSSDCDGSTPRASKCRSKPVDQRHQKYRLPVKNDREELRQLEIDLTRQVKEITDAWQGANTSARTDLALSKSFWKRIAEQQREQRTRLEEQRARLAAIVRSQGAYLESLGIALRARPDWLSSIPAPVCSDGHTKLDPRRWLRLKSSYTAAFKAFLQDVQAGLARIDSVFDDCEMGSLLIGATSSLRRHHSSGGVVYVKYVSRWLKPSNFEDTYKNTWTMTKLLHGRHNPQVYAAISNPENTIAIAYRLAKTLDCGSTVSIMKHIVSRRYIDTDRVVRDDH